MATFTFNIPDADVPRVVNALCGGVNLSAIIPPSVDANGLPVVTPVAARTALAAVIKQIVVQYETAAAHASIVPPTMS